MFQLQIISPLDHPNFLHTVIPLINEEGKVIRSLHDPTGEMMAPITKAFEMNNELLIGSFNRSSISRLKL